MAKKNQTILADTSAASNGTSEPVNTLSRVEIDARAIQLGELNGAGGDALPTLALEVASWAEQNKIRVTKLTQAEREAGIVDDIEAIFNLYANASNAKSVNARSTNSNSLVGQYSKLRKFGEQGAAGRGGSDFLMKTQSRRNELVRKSGGKAGGFKPAFDAMLSAIRMQANAKAALSVEELDAAIRTAGKKPANLIDLWERIQAAASEMVKEGKDRGVEATNVLAYAEKRCGELAEGKKIAKWLAKAPAGLGGINNFGIPQTTAAADKEEAAAK